MTDDPFKGPFPIRPPQSDSIITVEERIALDKARNERRMQWAFMTVLGLAALALIIPMGVWLTRLAMGG
jgi:hypothetical protein